MVLKLGVSKPSSLRGICTKKVWVYMLVTLACIPFKVVHLGSKKGANQFAGELWNGLTCWCVTSKKVTTIYHYLSGTCMTKTHKCDMFFKPLFSSRCWFVSHFDSFRRERLASAECTIRGSGKTVLHQPKFDLPNAMALTRASVG